MLFYAPCQLLCHIVCELYSQTGSISHAVVVDAGEPKKDLLFTLVDTWSVALHTAGSAAARPGIDMTGRLPDRLRAADRSVAARRSPGCRADSQFAGIAAARKAAPVAGNRAGYRFAGSWRCFAA